MRLRGARMLPYAALAAWLAAGAPAARGERAHARTGVGAVGPHPGRAIARAPAATRRVRQTPAALRARARPRVVGPLADPIARLPPGRPGRLVFGVMGSADARVPARTAARMRALGAAIAGRGDVVLTGACTGLPQAAVEGASGAGGLTVGISPWRTRADHVRAGAPTGGLDVLQLTRLPDAHRGRQRPNLMGREIDNIERSDVVVIAGGRSGTLGEFAIAYEERRPIGVLAGTGGITPRLRDLTRAIRRAGKRGPPVLFDRDPVRLVDRLARAHARLAEAGESGPIGDR